MKKNEKLQAVLSKNLQNTINSIKDAKSTTSNASKEEAKPKAKTKKVTNKKKATIKEVPAATKAKVTKEVAKQQATSIKEKVVTERDVKYLYPEDIKDQLARKKWRQATRNEYRRLEREVFKFQDQNTKEAKKAIKEFEEFKKTHLKPGMAI